ncbi:MAG: tetratricopeptide repeat protein [Candidatus Binatia bacterium]
MRGTTNRKAFEVYLVGERRYSAISKKDMQISRKSFERATKLDPTFARAWGWRAYCHVRSIKIGWLPKNELRRAIEWARCGVALNPDDYSTHWDLAYCLTMTKDLKQALKSFKTALYLYDNFTDMLVRKPGLFAEMADAYVQIGKPREAIKLFRRATRVPDWYRWNYSWAYFHAGDYENAIRQLDAMDLRPGHKLYVIEIQLFAAAAYAKLAEQLAKQRDPVESSKMLQRSKEAITRLKTANPNVTLETARKRFGGLSRKSGENRWLGALRKAGLR